METEKLKPTPLMSLMDEYETHFGHPVPLGMEYSDTIEERLEQALKDNQPIPAFQNPKPRIDD